MSAEQEISVLETDAEHRVGVSFRNRETFFLPAAELKEYENILAGSAEQLFSVMEKQALHRMEMEKLALTKQYEAEEKSNSIHFSMGFLALLIFAGLAVFFTLWGMEKAAIAAVGCPALYGLSSLFHSKKTEK